MNSHYVFRSRWDVPISLGALWDEVERLLASDDPMKWWGSVEVTAYDGSNLALRAASVFGYQLTFQLKHLGVSRPERLTFDAEGDLRGSGVVTFVDGGASSAMDIDWRVDADRRWMRMTGWLLRPLFVAGHHLIMRQGEKHLNAWLGESR